MRSAPSRSAAAQPGSLWWLLNFNLRLLWRRLLGNKGARRLIPLAVIAALLLAGLGSLLLSLRGQLSVMDHLSGLWLLGAGALSLLALGLMVSAGIAAALESLYDRGDLDLLLQAPLAPRVVFASRALGVLVSALLSVALLVAPLVLLGPALFGWHLLGAWPWWISAGLLASSLSLWITLGLVRLLGARRARTVAAVVGALFGAAFFLTFQLGNILGQGGQQSFYLSVYHEAQRAVNWPWLAALLYPARSIWLEPLPTVLTLLVTAGVFWLTILGLQRSFLTGLQSAGNTETKRGRTVHSAHLRFREGFWAAVFKEWRLIVRDPLLLSRVLLQLVYLIPLVVVVARQGSSHLLYGSGGVLLFASLAGALANLIMNGEEAPELLRLAPMSMNRIRSAKLVAAVLPVWGLMALVFVWLGTHGVLAWPWYVLCGVVSTTGTALIYLWRPMPVPRADIFRRRSNGDFLSGVGRLVLTLCLAAAAAGLPSHAWWGYLSLLAGLGLIGLFWGLRSQEV